MLFRKVEQRKNMKVAFLVLLVTAVVNADMYLHNPRGSNNRLDEANRERNNANRLFDSQNNNRGGYNVGSLYYYTGSTLSVEWTNQHSCRDANNHCEIIFQYMCADNVRDGATTGTIPDRLLLCENFNCNEDIEYGMHETFDYYINCRLRERNMGLFTADQNLRGPTAIYTRQNPGGTRRGYECPEERDYYPYWYYSPWIDVAVLTNDATRCPYYETESANVKSRWGCIVSNEEINRNLAQRNRVIIPNNEIDCRSKNGTWQEFLPNGHPPPQCMETLYSRDNHLGNGLGGFPNTFNWTIPDTPHENCVFRARYNISTQDYEAWGGEVTSANNTRLRNTELNLDVYSQFGLNGTEAEERGYLFENNPEVRVFNNATFRLRLAIDTSQFGRTFQDRSHTFAIRPRPSELGNAKIHNLNVRGKRGNIVQVYPGVEYDFVPNRLTVSTGDYIHIQWTGSNTNPNNNDGQGRAGSDRSNIVLLRDQVYDEGRPGAAVPLGTKFGHFGNSYPAHLDNSSFLGMPRHIKQSLAVLDNVQFGGEMSELDDAGTYFDIGAWKITSVGTYHFLCTRNNNFSNRSQKGKIIVVQQDVSTNRIGWNGGEVRVKDHHITVERGAFTEPTMFVMQQWPNSIADQAVRELAGRNVALPDDSRTSDVVTVSMEGGGSERKPFTITMTVDDTSDTKIVRYSAANGWNGQELDTEVSGDTASAESDQDGVFVATSSPNQYVLIGALVGSLVVVLLIIGGVVLFFVIRRDKWRKVKASFKNAKTGISRSFASKV